MNKNQLPTNQLHDINWGALDHASQCTHVTTMYIMYMHNINYYNSNNSCIIPLCIGIVIRDNKIMYMHAIGCKLQYQCKMQKYIIEQYTIQPL